MSVSIDEFLEEASESNEELLYPSDLKEAVIGLVDRFGMRSVILLDKEKCLQIFQERDGMTAEEAEEHFEFNVIGSWVGESTPCFATLIKE